MILLGMQMQPGCMSAQPAHASSDINSTLIEASSHDVDRHEQCVQVLTVPDSNK